MKLYRCYSIYLENYLTENGLQPIRYEGDTAVFQYNKKLQDLLDLYWIKHKVFKEL